MTLQTRKCPSGETGAKDKSTQPLGSSVATPVFDWRRFTKQQQEFYLWAWERGRLIGFDQGYIDGYKRAVEDHKHQWIQEWFERGWKACEDYFTAIMALCLPYLEDAIRYPDFATLCDMRGDHERAEHQRQTLKEHGVWYE